MPNPTVAEYVVDRLADLGIGHVFGVPGDYSFPIDLAIHANRRLKWIGCNNELNAAYSADGYARIHGAAMLAVELSSWGKMNKEENGMPIITGI